MVECTICLEACIKKIFTKMFAVSKAGVCKMYEQVSQGVQLWFMTGAGDETLGFQREI